MTARAVCLTWNNECWNYGQSRCCAAVAYLWVTSAWNKTNNLKWVEEKPKKKPSLRKVESRYYPTLFVIRSEAFRQGTKVDISGVQSHRPYIHVHLPCPPSSNPVSLPDNACIRLPAKTSHARLWILPLAASLFDFSRRLPWIEARVWQEALS